jgi:chloramphenicol 3-O-phosphotransferase
MVGTKLAGHGKKVSRLWRDSGATVRTPRIGRRERATMARMTDAIILTGAPGSGKSAVLGALSTLFEIDRVTFGAIESEELARGFPWLPPQQWLRQLTAVVSLQREAGRETFAVVATTENEQELRAVIDAIGAERLLVVCLTAPADLVAERLERREPDSWPGKRGLIEHARRLALEIPAIPGIDVTLSTVDRNADEVADEIRELTLARGLVRRA